MVPLRGMPTRISGAATGVVAKPGWVRCHSRTRSRLARLSATCASSAIIPISLRSASLVPDAQQRVETVAERRVAVVVEGDRGRHLLQQPVDIHQMPRASRVRAELVGIGRRRHEEELVGAGIARVVDRGRSAHRA